MRLVERGIAAAFIWFEGSDLVESSNDSGSVHRPDFLGISEVRGDCWRGADRRGCHRRRERFAMVRLVSRRRVLPVGYRRRVIGGEDLRRAGGRGDRVRLCGDGLAIVDSSATTRHPAIMGSIESSGFGSPCTRLLKRCRRVHCRITDDLSDEVLEQLIWRTVCFERMARGRASRFTDPTQRRGGLGIPVDARAWLAGSVAHDVGSRFRERGCEVLSMVRCWIRYQANEVG